ncbi:MAG: hypothetical protein JSV27_04340 [Candidatus Bathyarchaeota archaeon]|nr:MAG: hypothetical protein JSV27_04340 [Candidatus Bathyarchaeota archaeon]
MSFRRLMALLVIALVAVPTSTVQGASTKINDSVTVTYIPGPVVELSAKALVAVNASTYNYQHIAEGLLAQAEKARERLEEAFGRLQDVNVSLEAREIHQLALNITQEAQQLMLEGNHTVAAERALQALRYYGEAMVRLQGALQEEMPESVREGAEEALGIGVSVRRGYAFLEKLNALVDRIEEDGRDVSAAREYISQIRERLGAASADLEEGLIDEAKRELAEARTQLGRANGFVQAKMKEIKEIRTENFMQQVRSRIQDLEDKIDQVAVRLEATNTLRAKEALNQAMERIRQMENRFTGANVEEALNELKGAVNRIEYGLDELDGSGTSVQIRAIYQVKARLQVLHETASRLESRGMDASRVRTELAKTEGLLNSMMEQLRRGDTDAVDDLLARARESFEGLKDDVEPTRSQTEENIKEHIKELLDAANTDATSDTEPSLTPTD